MRNRRRGPLSAQSFVAIIVLGLAIATTPSAVARTTCSFTLGFKALHDLIPDVVGDCIENEQVDPRMGT